LGGVSKWMNVLGIIRKTSKHCERCP
jgi:hypothetical protein